MNHDRAPYNPIMSTLFAMDSFKPALAKQFSIALSRDSSNIGIGGTFIIGGVPANLKDPAINTSSPYGTSAPWQHVKTRSTSEFTFYSILVDGIKIGSTIDNPGLQIILDSGANMFQVPAGNATDINKLWTKFNADGSISCHVTLAKPVGVVIGGVMFWIEPSDLLLPNADGKSCQSLVSSCDKECVMGDPFLKNVLAMFDWDNKEMS